MRRWKWLAILAVMGALAAIPWATSALANGPAETQTPPLYGDQWQEMYDFCHGAGGMMGGWGMGAGSMGLTHPVTLQRVADTLGLTYEGLTARLAQGVTIAQIAQAQGMALESVITTILAPQSETLQVRVKYGYLSQTQAEAILEQAQLWVEQAVTVPLYGYFGPTDRPTTEYGPGYGDATWGDPGGMMGGGMMGGGMMGW